ncbi:fimbrial protein [Enterobacter roggenkampii]|uniref:fimbrial protein n=1 Tax=Enterobacter roggenkampii TaxID=1812935 RepID=UPI003BD3407D
MDIPITISGEVYIPSCQINNGKDIEVDFGNIAINDVNNHKNQKVITLPIACNYANSMAYVKVLGSQLAGNVNVLSTNIDNFGIALFQGEGTATKLIIGNGQSTNQGPIGYPVTDGVSGHDSSIFVMTAVPFKNGDGVLQAASFSSTASIAISYL